MSPIVRILLATLVLPTSIACNAEIKNRKTENVKIDGNCGMCETTIETAGNIKKVAKVDWDKDTKMAIITYDSTKTNQDEILKRIALAGYDNDKFLAPDDVYSKLHGCCQYERVTKTAIVKTEVVEDHSSHNQDARTTEKTTETAQEVNQLKSIFDNYFALKDALVKSDGKLASSIAKELLSNINAVNMTKLSTDEHTVWMKVMKDLALYTELIEKTKDAGHQRDHFTSLSKNMYTLIKVSKQETPIYYQNCTMYNDGKGANWLSKESRIKNPYYGSQMLSCGKTVETIK
jgi:copper chaperone CopZ